MCVWGGGGGGRRALCSLAIHNKTKNQIKMCVRPCIVKLAYSINKFENSGHLFQGLEHKYTPLVFVIVSIRRRKTKPLERFELSTPGLQDQCSNH